MASPAPPAAKFWRVSLWLAASAGWLASAWSLAAPSETESALVLGYSPQRLLLAVALLTPAIFFSQQAIKQVNWSTGRLVDWVTNPKRFRILAHLAALLFCLCWALLFLPPARAGYLLGEAGGYLPRLEPLLAYATLLSALFLANLLISCFGWHGDVLQAERPLLRTAAWLLAVLLALWGLFALTGLGLGFDLTEWNAPGAPLLSSQVFLSALLGLAGTALAVWVLPRLGGSRLDLLLFLLIWLGAAFFWMAQPAQANYYSSPPVAPNFEPYPLSDAFNHDVIASNLAIGEEMRFGGLRAIRKPLYAIGLAGLHLLAGDNYKALIEWQVLALALLPAILFFLARRLHGRLAGLILALLIILREANAIRLGHVINLSHAKLLMADLPAALALALFGLLVLEWLSRRGGTAWMALASGGAAGLLLLLRSQNLTLIPAILLLALLALRRSGLAWRPLFPRLALFVVGVALAATPWLLRNKHLTGEFILEQSTAASYLAQRYSADPAEIITVFLPGESEGEYYARHMDQVKSFIAEHPGQVAGFLADNYLRNLYLTVMPLPLSWELRELESHVRQLPYWPSWVGTIQPESWLPLFCNLALIAIGLAAAWQRWGWAGLTPLAINLGFTLNLALARVSGWRYNQPVDWTLILYFALGLAQVLVWLFAFLGKAKWLEDVPSEAAVELPARQSRGVLLTALIVLALGCAPLAVEAISSPRFDRVAPAEADEWLEAVKAPESLRQPLADGQLAILHGSALYPRYYQAGQGIIGSDFPLTATRPFARLTFFLIGPHPGEVLLPQDTGVEDFASGAEVLVFQCLAPKERVLGVLNLDSGQLYSAPPELRCDEL